MSVDRLERHVLDLAERHNVEVVFKPGTRPRALSKRGERPRQRRKSIRVPPIRGQVSYLTALHELGHHAHRGRSWMRRLDKEGAAWEWALDNAIIEPTPATWSSIFSSLNSYSQWARRRLGVVPEEESAVFLRVVDRTLAALGEERQ